VTDIDNAIKVGELMLATAEGLIDAITKAKQSLEDSTAQLKQSIAEAKKKMRDDLAADRKEADDALDKKFDRSKNGDEA
jgi:hypothetical protein